MSREHIALTKTIEAYIREISLREPEVLARLRAETQKLRAGDMQISPMQGQLMALLAQAIGARRCLEVGPSPDTARSSWHSRCRRTAS